MNFFYGPVLSLFTDLSSGLIASGGPSGVRLYDSAFKNYKQILTTKNTANNGSGKLCISAVALNTSGVKIHYTEKINILWYP